MLAPLLVALLICISSIANAQPFFASYYGHGEKLNTHTSNGERFNPNDLTAAHRSLPFGTRIELRRGNRRVVVRINDRGPAAWTGRNLDLSTAAAAQLGYLNQGVAHLQGKVIHKP